MSKKSKVAVAVIISTLLSGFSIHMALVESESGPSLFSADQIKHSIDNMPLLSGEKAYSRDEIIQALNVTPLFDESSTPEKIATAKTIMLCSHGHNSSGRTVSRFFKYYAPQSSHEVAWLSFDYLQKPAFFSAAQEFDVLQLRRRVEALIRLKKDDQKIILWGHSNGASTIISLLGAHPEYEQHIERVILLAPFAKLQEVFPKFFSLFGAKLYFKIAKKTSARAFNEKAKNPVDYFNERLIPHRIPIMFIHASNDFIVPYQNMKSFKKACKEHYPRVTFYRIDTGGHTFWLNPHHTKVLQAQLSSFFTQNSNLTVA